MRYVKCQWRDECCLQFLDGVTLVGVMSINKPTRAALAAESHIYTVKNPKFIHGDGAIQVTTTAASMCWYVCDSVVVVQDVGVLHGKVHMKRWNPDLQVSRRWSSKHPSGLCHLPPSQSLLQRCSTCLDSKLLPLCTIPVRAPQIYTVSANSPTATVRRGPDGIPHAACPLLAITQPFHAAHVWCMCVLFC